MFETLKAVLLFSDGSTTETTHQKFIQLDRNYVVLSFSFSFGVDYVQH